MGRAQNRRDSQTPMAISNNSSSNVAVVVAVSLLFTGVLYLICFFWFPNPLSALQHYASNSPKFEKIEMPVDELDATLERAAFGNNKTVVITVMNKAYVEQSGKGRTTTTMLNLFLESLWEGEGTRQLVDNLMVVAVDQTAYDRCKFMRLHCYKLQTDDVDFAGEKVYMSSEFIKMMWHRTFLLLQILRRGYSFIFTDMDVMWVRNPFPRLSRNESVDMDMSVDSRVGHYINTGFYYVRSNNKTISLFEKWYSMKDNSTGMKEQDVLKSLLDNGFFDRLNLHVNFLATVQFSGFCQDSPDFGAVTTIHANCCRHITAKIADLTTVLRDWKRYKAAIARHRTTRLRFSWTPHANCWNSWNDTHYEPQQ